MASPESWRSPTWRHANPGELAERVSGDARTSIARNRDVRTTGCLPPHASRLMTRAGVALAPAPSNFVRGFLTLFPFEPSDTLCKIRLNTVPEFDAADDGQLRRGGRLFPAALVLPGQGDQHLSRPRAVAITI